MNKYVMIDGREVEFASAVNLMDGELREEIHARGITDAQDFVNAYAAAHAARFGETFRVE